LTRYAAAVDSPKERAVLETAHAHPEPVKPSALARALALPEPACAALVQELASEGRLLVLENGALVEPGLFRALCQAAEAFVLGYFREHRERLVCDRTTLREKLRLDSALLDEVLKTLTTGGKVEAEPGGGARLAGVKTTLAPELVALRERALTRLRSAGFQPPTLDELATELGTARPALDGVLKRLVDEKLVSRVSPEYHFSNEAIARAKEAVVRNCGARAKPGEAGDVDLPSLRDELGTTRRWLIPLMEWFDGTGFTTRLGGRRILKRRP
jgi:selenocysteine-specific elongation factor